MGNDSAPRLFCIPAQDAPVLAVIRRGPVDWFQIGKWDLEKPAYEPGAWFKGSLYPQRCDISPDGRWFCYLALRDKADWSVGQTFLAVSRLPWLTALAAWPTDGTWTRGLHFTGKAEHDEKLGAPEMGDLDSLRKKFGLAFTEARQFSVEQRRGWTESDKTSARKKSDIFDQHRDVHIQKTQPGDKQSFRLTATGKFAAFREMSQDYWGADDLYYVLRDRRMERLLADVQWADWDRKGRLIVATVEGKLQIRELKDIDDEKITFYVDLAPGKPDPQPSPVWASDW